MTSLTPLDTSVFTLIQATLNVDLVFDTQFSVTSYPTLVINTSDISKETEIGFTLLVTSAAPGDTSTATYTFIVQLIDNPCVGGFTGLPASNTWDLISLVNTPFSINFTGITNGECDFSYDLLNDPSMSPADPTIFAITQPTLI